MNVSIDTAVEPSGLCGLVVRTFVARLVQYLAGGPILNESMTEFASGS